MTQFTATVTSRMSAKNTGREKLAVPSTTRATSCSNINTPISVVEQRRHTCTATDREEKQDLLDNLSISIHRISLTSESEGIESNTQEGEPFVKVIIPTTGTRWIRGQSAAIKWNVLDPTVERVAITIMSEGKSEGIESNTQEGEPFVKVIIPTTGTRWIRGQSAAIKWNVLDPTVERVAITIMSEGSSATTVVTNSTPNDGIFTYLKVPWGMECGTKYFLRFTNVHDLLRSFTTNRFEIGSAP
ncbi:hypothetical protein ABG067_003258 [Albugo candida]